MDSTIQKTSPNFTKKVGFDIGTYKSNTLNKPYVCVNLESTHMLLYRINAAKEGVNFTITSIESATV